MPIGARAFTRADSSITSWRSASRTRKKLSETKRFAEANAVPFGDGELPSSRWSSMRPRTPGPVSHTPIWTTPPASASTGVVRFGLNAQVLCVPQSAAGQHIASAWAWAFAPLPLQ